MVSRLFLILNMNDFKDDDVTELTKILSMFADSKIMIVTGKHYGTIVSSSDLEDSVELFLSYGDLELALN